ncbi:UDP-Glycosyltransferase superfamily protein [Actinidia rufa]|uniref:Glycosyltransferase n=1 Tax=Actinidia rufa TaxID=165716 RepID=A0A7J0EEG4_9ERIC|nr:UDP-Glycosyltransferase superfamily protein [Actinidia rufa]
MDVQNQNPSQYLSSYEQAQVVVVVVPFPCQSHLNQLLHLSCLISSYNIPVHYACSAAHIHQAKLRFIDMNRLEKTKINFHEFPTPPFLSPPPNPNSSTRFPAHLQPSFEASVHLRDPMAALLRRISATARRVIVIHDVLMAYVVQDIATLPNAKSYSFHPTCAFSTFFDGWQMKGKPFLEEKELERLPSIEGCYTFEILNFIALQVDFLELRTGGIYNSCRAIEGTYIDFMANEEFNKNKQMWAIGPLNTGTVYERRNSNSRHTNIKELANGLEQSKHKFIWVLRDADKGDIFTGDVKRYQLPEGYEERVKEVGMVVRDWAPQVEILGHPSTGGFMSHCGWNSCLESITMGVPVAAWPMHSEQPKNAFLLNEILKVGLVVNPWELRDELVTSSTIAEAVKRLMASKEGDEMRKRVEKLGVATRQSVEEDRKSTPVPASFAPVHPAIHKSQAKQRDTLNADFSCAIRFRLNFIKGCPWVIFLASMVDCDFPLASGLMTLIMLLKAVHSHSGLVWLNLPVVMSHLFVGVVARGQVAQCCYVIGGCPF